jgi:transposase-like protein
MLKMSVKRKGAAPPLEGTASAIRESSRSSAEGVVVPERPKRRTFTAEYKLGILEEADAATASGVTGAVGALLRREGLYSSHLTDWRRERDTGVLIALAPKKRGPKPRKNELTDELAKTQRELERVKRELAKANAVIDVQRRVAALLGEAVPEPTEEDFARAQGRFRPGRLDIKPGKAWRRL